MHAETSDATDTATANTLGDCNDTRLARQFAQSVKVRLSLPIRGIAVQGAPGPIDKSLDA
jgi:hypothetical protein